MTNENIVSILEHEADAVRHIPVTPAFDEAITLIVEHVHHRRGRLITSGMGKAGQIAMNIATTFSSTGTPAFFLHPSEAQHGDLGIIRDEDLLLLISNSGATREIVDLVTLTHRLYPSMPMIVITGKEDSPLARQADITLLTGGAPEGCPLGLAPTVMTVIGDVLVVNVMRATGFTAEQYALRHHGGYLGRKSRHDADAG